MEVSRQADIQLKPIVTASTHGLALTPISPFLHGPVPVWHLGWVSVGAYKIESSVGAWTDEQFAMLDLPGWERFTRIHEGENVTLVFSPTDDKSLHTMVLLTKQGDQLVIIKMSGRLDKVIEAVPRISDLVEYFHIDPISMEFQSDCQS
jgi:hypothetical protein